MVEINKSINLDGGVFEGDGCNIFFKFIPSDVGDGIIFFFPGAYDRSKGAIQFQRHSWSSDYTDRYHCVIIDDPTINDNNELSIGWFQGWEGCDLYSSLCNMVSSMCSTLDIGEEKVVFFGSSAGGFISLKLSEYFLSATVLAINPQLFINRFYEGKYNVMLDYCYSNKKSLEIEGLVSSKFRYTPSKNIKNEKGFVCIFQNKVDLFHVKNHLDIFLSCFSKDNDIAYHDVNEFDYGYFCKPSGKLNVYYYIDDYKKHSPPDREDTKVLIRSLLDSFV